MEPLLLPLFLIVLKKLETFFVGKVSLKEKLRVREKRLRLGYGLGLVLVLSLESCEEEEEEPKQWNVGIQAGTKG